MDCVIAGTRVAVPLAPRRRIPGIAGAANVDFCDARRGHLRGRGLGGHRTALHDRDPHRITETHIA